MFVFANKAGYRINLPFIAENYNVYSDKLMLGVIDLNHIELATDEDKQYNIDYWAKLFKAKTWEEIKMLSAENNYMAEAANTIFKLSSEEQIRKRCRDREEYYQDLRNYERTIAEKDAVIAEKNSEIEMLKAELTKLKK